MLENVDAEEAQRLRIDVAVVQAVGTCSQVGAIPDANIAQLADADPGVPPPATPPLMQASPLEFWFVALRKWLVERSHGGPEEIRDDGCSDLHLVYAFHQQYANDSKEVALSRLRECLQAGDWIGTLYHAWNLQALRRVGSKHL